MKGFVCPESSVAMSTRQSSPGPISNDGKAYRFPPFGSDQNQNVLTKAPSFRMHRFPRIVLMAIFILAWVMVPSSWAKENEHPESNPALYESACPSTSFVSLKFDKSHSHKKGYTNSGELIDGSIMVVTDDKGVVSVNGTGQLPGELGPDPAIVTFALNRKGHGKHLMLYKGSIQVQDNGFELVTFINKSVKEYETGDDATSAIGSAFGFARPHKAVGKLQWKVIDNSGPDFPNPDFLVENTDNAGLGSFRQAVLDANAAGGSNVIGFVPALAGGTIVLNTQVLIDSDVTIDGSEAPGVALDGGGAVRVLDIAPDRTVLLNALTIQNGKTEDCVDCENGEHGAGIRAQASTDLTLCSSTLMNNKTGTVSGCESDDPFSASCNGGHGGGIFQDENGKLTLERSILSNNRTGDVLNCMVDDDPPVLSTSCRSGFGAGIYQSVGGELVVKSSQAINNSTGDILDCGTPGSFASIFCGTGSGGGVLSSTLAMVSNSTFESNKVGSVLSCGQGTFASCGRGQGGGIGTVSTGSVLNVYQTTFDSNTAESGGAISRIFVGGGTQPVTITIDRSTFKANIADEFGGAIRQGGGSLASILDITNSTFVENLAPTNFNTSGVPGGIGGAVMVSASTVLTIENSTMTKNLALSGGGAIWHSGFFEGSGSVTIRYGTFSENMAPIGTDIAGNQEFTDPFPLTLFGTVFSGDGPHCVETVNTTSEGFNFEETTNTCGLNQPTDTVLGGDPGLGPLAENGGPTETQLPGPPLVNAIPNPDCFPGITEDQRGFARPGEPGGACDIGAVEIQEMKPDKKKKKKKYKQK